ncbi:DUF4276 family protein [Puteibacter caeruleilacunae]|nr:DUF4276 family protein [Puteibacter caeruleilacunae]
MVNIKIVIEGGIMPNSNDLALTVNNSEKLRESFYKLLSQVISPQDFNLEIEMGAGEKNACKIFKNTISKQECTLLIDLDGGNEIRNQRLAYLEVQEYADFVFFMIQQMEAWILSQPTAIEKTMSHLNREKQDQRLNNDPIFQTAPYDIQHADDKLNTILARYYSFIKRGKKKKKKYGKLKDAPLFIANLDVNQLMETFNDVNRLIEHIQSHRSN